MGVLKGSAVAAGVAAGKAACEGKAASFAHGEWVAVVLDQRATAAG